MAGASTSAMMAITDVNRHQVYPPALRYHIDVIMNPNTFFETLQSFHTTMGTRFMIPVTGRQKLDLYQLYFLVTQRGGIEKAVLDGKWREVVGGLSISHTITNRSLVLKKHYFKLLFHYEQVYYFRRQGPIVTPPFTVRQRSYPGFKFVNNSGQGMPLLRQPVFDQGSESSGSVPNHLLLGESQPEDGMPLLHQPVFDQVSVGSVPHHLPLGESQLEDVEPLPEDEVDDDVAESYPVPAAPASVENGNDHAASGDRPSDPALGVDALNVAQSAPSNVADDGDATPSFVALSPSFRENEPIGAQSFPTNMAAQGIGENMLAGGMLVHNNLVTVNTGSHISHGVQPGPLPASNSSFLFSAPSTSAVHPQPCWSAYDFYLQERISMFRNLPSQSMRQLIRLIEVCWGRLTEAERGVYADQERMDRERYVRELNEYQERIRRMQSK